MFTFNPIFTHLHNMHTFISSHTFYHALLKYAVFCLYTGTVAFICPTEHNTIRKAIEQTVSVFRNDLYATAICLWLFYCSNRCRMYVAQHSTQTPHKCLNINHLHKISRYTLIFCFFYSPFYHLVQLIQNQIVQCPDLVDLTNR